MSIRGTILHGLNPNDDSECVPVYNQRAIHCNNDIQKILDACGVENIVSIELLFDDSPSMFIADKLKPNGWYLKIKYKEK